MKGLPNWFIPLWCIAMPVTSLLIVPSVQGTIPAYMLAFVSAFFVLVSRRYQGRASFVSLYPDHIPGGLPLYCPLLPFLLSAGMDAVCFVGRMVPGHLRHL